MTILECVNERRSRRLYLNKDISNKVLEVLLKTAIRAPFGGSPKPKCQVFEAIVIRDKSIIEKLALHYEDRQFMKMAPVVIACCANKNNDPDYKEWLISASLSIQNILIAAESQNLGSCFITCFMHNEKHKEDKKNLRDILNLPKYIELVGLISLGYKVEQEELKTKILREYDDIVSYETYGNCELVKHS